MFKWVSRLFGWVKTAPESPVKAVSAALRALMTYLGGKTPGGWASDHFEEASKFTGWNYPAIHAAACQAAQAEMKLVRKVRKETQDVEEEHPALQLLKRPNPFQSSFLFRYAAAQQLRITGTALIWTVRNGVKAPRAMYVLPTGLAVPQPPMVTPDGSFPAGYYKVQPLSNYGWVAGGDDAFDNAALNMLALGCNIDAREVTPIRWPHPLYMNDGQSPLAAGALANDVSEQINRSRWHMLKQAALLGMLLQLDENSDMKDDQRKALEQQLIEKFAGTLNAGRIMVLPPGLKKTEDRGAAELDFVGAHPQVRDEVLASHQSPPIAIGVTEAGSYAALYAALLQYTELNIQPMLSLIGGGLTQIIQSFPAWKDLECLLTAKRIDDPTIKATELTTHITARAITVNEYRELIGMPPTDEAWGNERVGTPAKTPKPTKPEEDSPRTQLGDAA